MGEFFFSVLFLFLFLFLSFEHSALNAAFSAPFFSALFLLVVLDTFFLFLFPRNGSGMGVYII